MSKELCAYIDQRVQSEGNAQYYSILHQLGITTTMTPELLLELLEGWAKLGTFKTTLRHMHTVYSFLSYCAHPQSQASQNIKSDILKFMQTGKSVFVPNRGGKPGDRSASEGEFRRVRDVCWQDPSGASKHFHQGLAEVKMIYPDDNLQYFFCNQCKIPERPSTGQEVQFLVRAAKTLAFDNALHCCQILFQF